METSWFRLYLIIAIIIGILFTIGANGAGSALAAILAVCLVKEIMDA